MSTPPRKSALRKKVPKRARGTSVERALRESEERLRSVVSSAPVVLWETDRDGVVLLSEGKGLEVLGFAPGQLVGVSVYDIFPDAGDNMISAIRRCLAEGTAQHEIGEVAGAVFDTHLTPTFRRGKVCGLIGVSVDVTERVRMESAMGGLSRQLWAVQEEERRRIARELHDEAGQEMTALKLQLDLARRESDPGRVRQKLDDAARLAASVLEELRRISQDLRPGTLDELGLVPALRALAEDFRRRSGLEISFSEPTLPCPKTETDCEAAVFRFFQEALTNIARHARAKTATLSLDHAGGIARACVRDDGAGFDPEEILPKGRVGLVGMQERAKMLGGSLKIESRQGKGTRLTLEIPIPTPTVMRRFQPRRIAVS